MNIFEARGKIVYWENYTGKAELHEVYIMDIIDISMISDEINCAVFGNYIIYYRTTDGGVENLIVGQDGSGIEFDDKEYYGNDLHKLFIEFNNKKLEAMLDNL